MTATTPQPPVSSGGGRATDGPGQVGPYRLLAKIGEGGMGVVHLAQAPDGRRLALKVLRPHVIGDDEARERLAREVASLRRVTSPRVAEVLDADPWGETPYVATRYVPGLSLHEHAREEGPLEGADLSYFAAGLAEAVVAVHRVGVLHRDIKPSNVLLEGRSPVLIDFGLARLAEDPRLTHTGWLLGTPGYLAPEILYGDDATAASDVHSWAATVVFAATGRPPFGTGPAMAIMDRVRRGEHDLSAVPSALLPLLEACLAPEPGDRPDTTAVLSSLHVPGAGVPRPARAPEPDDDLTLPVWLDAPHPTTRTTVAPPEPSPPPTRALTRVVPPPAREPYEQPAPPRAAPESERPRLVPPDSWRPAPSGLPRTQRVLLLLGLFAAVTTAFAGAPYLTASVVGLLALVVRTLSWTTESARERQHLRGRRRWYDAPLTALTTPWYLVVATAGTVVLLLWAGLLALLAGLALLLFRGPLVPGLLLMGGVFSTALWWGPGARRLRVPTRRVLRLATRRAWTGWCAVVVVAVAVMLLGQELSQSGVRWDPAPGAPWRSGTLLGDVVGHL